MAGKDPVEVVGESFHQDELLGLTGGQRSFGGVDVETVAELVPTEGDGIEVLVGGTEIGYLRRSDGGRLRTVIEDSIDRSGVASCGATIRGGWDRGGDDPGLFGVTL